MHQPRHLLKLRLEQCIPFAIFISAENCKLQLIVVSIILAERHPETVGILLSTRFEDLYLI